MTKKQLGASIDELGKLRDKLHGLLFTEKALTAMVREALKGLPGKTKAAKGAKYEAELLASESIEVEVAALRALAGRKFGRCVKVDLAAARRELGAKAVDALGTKRRSYKVRVVSREPAKAPRRAPGKGT